MRTMMTTTLVAAALAATITTTHAGRGVGKDLQAADFAGEPTLEDILDDQARLTMPDSTQPAGRRLVSRGEPVRRIKDALNALSFIGRQTYDLGPRGNPAHPEYDLYDHALWLAIIKFKRDNGLVPADWGDVGPKTMETLDAMFRRAPVPPPPPARRSDADLLTRAERALPAMRDAGPRRRVGCMLALLKDPTVLDGYPDFRGMTRTLPPPKEWKTVDPVVLASAIGGNMRHVMRQLRSVVPPARDDAELARSLEAIDDDIGRNLQDFWSQTAWDSAQGTVMRTFNATIGAWELSPRHVLSCYAWYARRRPER